MAQFSAQAGHAQDAREFTLPHLHAGPVFLQSSASPKFRVLVIILSADTFYSLERITWYIGNASKF